VAANSPARQLPTAAKPLILSYGADESQEFARHSTAYGRALAERGIPCAVRPLVGHNHMSICTALADRKSEPTQMILGRWDWPDGRRRLCRTEDRLTRRTRDPSRAFVTAVTDADGRAA